MGCDSFLLWVIRRLLFIFWAPYRFNRLGDSWSFRRFFHWFDWFGDCWLLNRLFYRWLSFARLSDRSLSRFSLLNSHLIIRIVTLFLLALWLFDWRHFSRYFGHYFRRILYWFCNHFFYLGLFDLYLWFFYHFFNNLGRGCWSDHCRFRHDLLVSGEILIEQLYGGTSWILLHRSSAQVWSRSPNRVLRAPLRCHRLLQRWVMFFDDVAFKSCDVDIWLLVIEFHNWPGLLAYFLTVNSFWASLFRGFCPQNLRQGSRCCF